MFSANRLPASLSVPRLVLRHRTACRSASSAALLVSSTPSTRAKAYRAARAVQLLLRDLWL
jgi:hypothetical protein